MADDPRIFLTEPVGGNLAAFSAAEYVLSPRSGEAGSAPEHSSQVYLLANGRISASKSAVMGGRLVAIATPPALAAPTWNPEAIAGGVALSNGLLTASKTLAENGWASVRAKQGRSTEFGGKYYFEIRCQTGAGAVDAMYGISKGTLPLNGADGFVGAGASGESYSIYQRNGNLFTAGAATAFTSGWGASTDVVLGFALDMTAGKGWFSMNNVFVGDPVEGTGAMFDNMSGVYYPTASFYNGSGVFQADLRLTAASITGTIPSGFQAFNS